MEEKYWELREEMERAYDKWRGEQTDRNWYAYRFAKTEFEMFCVDVLTSLMEENSDVLARLKA